MRVDRASGGLGRILAGLPLLFLALLPPVGDDRIGGNPDDTEGDDPDEEVVEPVGLTLDRAAG